MENEKANNILRRSKRNRKNGRKEVKRKEEGEREENGF